MKTPPYSLLFLSTLLLGEVTSFASATTYTEPVTLASKNGVLDILMIAKSAPITSLPGNPKGWVFQICQRPIDNSNVCPESGSATNYYGGTRLQLEKGDLLKIRLVNQLPPAWDSEHATEVGQEYLLLNPVNLHTHGLVVSPHGPAESDVTYGDNTFVLTFNSANGKPLNSSHLSGAVRYDYTDYTIRVPYNHPSGLYWFHPDAQGIALNQISGGLAGIITVGHVNDYVCKNTFCSPLLPHIGVRHLILKDTQILPDGKQLTQEDSDFGEPEPDVNSQSRLGIVPGIDSSTDGGANYAGGAWYFSVNGQVYPTVPVNSAAGEIWRITNASANVTYDLNLFNPVQGHNMIMQVLSADGVSISPASDLSEAELTELGGWKFKAEACPAGKSALLKLTQASLCTRDLTLAPGARIEVWVTYRDKDDVTAPAPKGTFAIFRTAGYSTGPDGDSWPQVDLARVNFVSPVQVNTPPVLGVTGEATALSNPTAIGRDLSRSNQAAPIASCQALALGHMRRIFYGIPTADSSRFGIAYEEIDELGNVVGKPAADFAAFSPVANSICLPLADGNMPVSERWQLINVSEEDHNFHINQTKFRVVPEAEQTGEIAPGSPRGKGIVLDNVTLPHSDGTCGNNPPADLSNPIADWRAGLCKAHPVTVEIPFAVAGAFVFHCDILEHEDAGMLAVVQVTPSGK